MTDVEPQRRVQPLLVGRLVNIALVDAIQLCFTGRLPTLEYNFHDTPWHPCLSHRNRCDVRRIETEPNRVSGYSMMHNPDMLTLKRVAYQGLSRYTHDAALTVVDRAPYIIWHD